MGKGVGDLSIKASCRLVFKTYTIEDCTYYNATEKNYSGSNRHNVYDSNLSVALSTNAEISFDVNTDSSASSKDYRYWLTPKSLIDGMNYPSCSIWFDKKPSSILLGKRESGSTVNIGTYTVASNRYVTIKYVKNGTSINVYSDNNLLTTMSLDCIDNYSDWTISIMAWSGTGTRSIKNVKFKPL